MGRPSPPAPRGRRVLPGPSGGLGHGRDRDSHCRSTGKRCFRPGPLPPPGVPQPRMRTLPPPGKGKPTRPRVRTSRHSYVRVLPRLWEHPPTLGSGRGDMGGSRTLPTPPSPVHRPRARGPLPRPATARSAPAPAERARRGRARSTDRSAPQCAPIPLPNTAADTDSAAGTDSAADTDRAAAAAQAGS